ncbi:MAG: helix-turn-helix domain-containing protein [Phycisphaerales bacterium JB040]
MNAGNGTSARLLGHAVAGPFLVTHKAYSRVFRQAWHEHPVGSIDLVLAGGGHGTYAGEDIPAAAGGLGYYRHGVNHRFESGEAGIRSLHLIQPPEVVADSGVARDLTAMTLTDTPALRAMLAILRELQRPDASSTLEIETRAREALACAARDDRHRRYAAGYLKRSLEALHASVRSDVVDGVSLTELSELGGVHPGHLARSFKQRFGVSVGAYHRRLRVAEAARRLSRCDETIARVANTTGFADQAHLTRTMKRELGITPAALRRELGRA